MDDREHPAVDRDRLQLAVDLAHRCPLSSSAFSVGAVIVAATGDIVATGYSREDGTDAHAEEVALAKASVDSLTGATLYSSLEPCGERVSRQAPCTALILATGIERVVFALAEPPVFVTGHGEEQLVEAGIKVIQLPELAPGVEAVNAHLLNR